MHMHKQLHIQYNKNRWHKPVKQKNEFYTVLVKLIPSWNSHMYMHEHYNQTHLQYNKKSMKNFSICLQNATCMCMNSATNTTNMDDINE